MNHYLEVGTVHLARINDHIKEGTVHVARLNYCMKVGIVHVTRAKPMYAGGYANCMPQDILVPTCCHEFSAAIHF